MLRDQEWELGIRIQSYRLRILGLGFKVQGFRCRALRFQHRLCFGCGQPVANFEARV